MVMATDSGYRRRIGTLVQIKAEETSGQGLPKKYLKTKEVITFLWLYDILTLMLNSHYIPVEVILKQAAISVSHSHLLQVISK